jgi:hypothetical protein
MIGPTSTPEKTEKPRANVTASYETLGREGDRYFYKVTIRETNGIDVVFDVLLVEYTLRDRDGGTESVSHELDESGVIDRYGSATLAANGELDGEDWFGVGTEGLAYATYGETLVGRDAGGSVVSVGFTISTNEYDRPIP